MAALTQYKPLYKPNQLLCGPGQVVIVAGWTMKQVIARHLEPEDYAAIGQLYSATRGISILLRNLLVNPQIRHLMILNATKEDRIAGAGQCLLDFFRNGFQPGQTDTGRPCWLINSDITGYIDPEIPAEVLEQLRQALQVQDVHSIAELVTQTKALKSQTTLPPWGKPQEFPLQEPAPTRHPGPYIGHRIEAKTIAQAWVKIIHRIKTTGAIRPTAYGGQWQELIDLLAIVTDEPDGFYFPEPNYLPCDRPFIQDYIGHILDDAQAQEGVKYTYGQRLRSWFGVDQIQQLIEKLAQDLDSTRAVMSLWDVADYDLSDSPPCLNHIWVRVADQQVILTATFRSNDMFSAWPANAMGLRALQQHIRDELQKQTNRILGLGPLITHSQSAHIYDDCWDNAERLLQTHYSRLNQTRDYADPCGNFLISLNSVEKSILVEQTTPGSGEVVDCYGGKNATQLYRQIAAACPGLEVEHALYLGTELQKAEIALKMGLPYEQDRGLNVPGLMS